MTNFHTGHKRCVESFKIHPEILNVFGYNVKESNSLRWHGKSSEVKFKDLKWEIFSESFTNVLTYHIRSPESSKNHPEILKGFGLNIRKRHSFRWHRNLRRLNSGASSEEISFETFYRIFIPTIEGPEKVPKS